MPKRIDDAEVVEHLKWIKGLPEEGGAWGESIIQLAGNVVSELGSLSASKADIDTEIRKKRNFLRSLVKRASKEAPMLFSAAQIEKAKPGEDDEYEDVEEEGDVNAA